MSPKLALAVPMTYPEITSNERRAFILCAGDGSRWNNYLGVPKQLISFNGESLLDRTVRLLRNNGIYDIVCVARDPKISTSNMPTFFPDRYGCLSETVRSTSPRWTAQTIILLGDVFFTRRAIQRICTSDRRIMVFGRPWASHLVHCNHGELFAMCFSNTDYHHILRATQAVCELALTGARGNLWDIYHTLANIPYNSGRSESRFFTVIDDITNDFDCPRDYCRRSSIYISATSSSRIQRLKLGLELGERWPRHLASRQAVAMDTVENVFKE